MGGKEGGGGRDYSNETTNKKTKEGKRFKLRRSVKSFEKDRSQRERSKEKERRQRGRK